jgi:hypothetical protein
MLSRIVRDTGLTCALFVVLAIVVWPGQWRIPLGVVGGGVLIGLSLWAIKGTVDTWLGGGRPRASLGLVKFFTRYVMLGFAAYGMMARLHLDPVGMLAGVSALGVAAGAEALRGIRAPNVGRRG